MSVQITWIIESMLTALSEDGFTNVVTSVNWRCIGTENDVTTSVYGSVSISQPGDPFTPYDQLTQEQVLGWVWGSVDKDATEIALTAQVDAILNPPVVTLPNPW